MTNTINIQMNVDDKSLCFDDNNKLTVKISPKANNGLSIKDGKLIATKGADGKSSSGKMNLSGNAIGPNNATMSQELPIVGFNSTVSRHKKYTGDVAFLKDNDGPLMTYLITNSEGKHTLDVNHPCIATYMINRVKNGG